MEKTTQLYEGKAKKVYATTDPNLVIVDYKDDATAFDGKKKGTILGKGVINNRVTNHLMKLLTEKTGVPTHFVEEISERETVVKKVTIVPLEVIIRNVIAGSMSKRIGVDEGTELKNPVLEFCYKDDSLGDPFIPESLITAVGWATADEVATIKDYALKVNDFLISHFKSVGVIVVDFKLEFGRTSDGTIVLADEISPDTCRFWDEKTKEKLDKDRFRRDLGGEEDAYVEILHRLGLVISS